MVDRDRGTLKITHIGNDSQFLQFAAEAFESVAPGANSQIAICAPSDGVRFPAAHGRTVAISPTLRGALRLPFLAHGSDVIVAHAMTPYAAVAFLLSRRSVPKIWSGFGSDYYPESRPAEASSILDPRTLELFRASSMSARPSLPQRARALAIHHLARLAARRAHAFSAPIPSDYDVFRRRFDTFDGRFLQLNYASVESTFSVGGDAVTGDDVLVGNSATYASNHLDVLEKLAKLDLQGRRVVVPLSYGDPAYRDRVVDEGKRLLGGAFVPVVDLLPLHDYSALVGSCSTVVMGHRRQQALGNIGTALYRGARVYLHPGSPVLEFLRSRGAVVGALDDLRAGELLPPRLEPGEIARNREVLNGFWGERAVRSNIETLLSEMVVER